MLNNRPEAEGDKESLGYCIDRLQQISLKTLLVHYQIFFIVVNFGAAGILGSLY